MSLTLHDVALGLPQDTSLAVVIAGEPVTRTPGGRHAGFLVRGDDGRLWLFDLAWHNVYRKSLITADYSYVRLEFLDPYSEITIIGFLGTLLAASNGQLAYSIGYDEKIEYFDAKGGPAPLALGEGLTCATFVLEALRRYGFDLLDRDTWPVTPEMMAWQLDMIKKLPLTPQEFLAQFRKIGRVPRFRPEEALGAANYFVEDPLGFPEVQKAADEVVDGLVQQYKDWPPATVSRWKPTPAEAGAVI